MKEGCIIMQTQTSFSHDHQPTLYIVSTPIGNLDDITYRAVETLKMVDLILCEDTRVTSKLLKAYDIDKPLKSYQKFNERASVDEIIDIFKTHSKIALVSDAGTPLISDPGFILVDALLNESINVVSIPGPSAVLSALVTSGVETMPFTFLGFLPRKVGAIKDVLSTYVHRAETLVIYESPNRISKTLKIIYEVLGNRKLSIGRELTKKFETYYRGYLKDMVTESFDTRGEYVLIIEGGKEAKQTITDPIKLVDHYIKQGHTEKEAIKQASNDLGVHKSEVYKAYKINT